MTTYSLEAFAHVPRVEPKAKPKPKAKSPTSRPARCSGLTGVSSRFGDGWFSRLPRQQQERLALEMLRFAPRREEKGSGTYSEALALFAGLCHHFGAEAAIDLGRRSGWEGKDWDLDEVAGTITPNPNAAGIGTLIHAARKGGWVHPKELQDERALTVGRKVINVERRYLDAADFLTDAKLLAIKSPMETGKTQAIAQLTATEKVIAVTHRRSLADQLGQRLNLPVMREGKVIHQNADHQDSADRGCVVVVDSSGPGGSCYLKPESCADAVLFIDEADQAIRHMLNSDTEIQRHRAAVLSNFVECCRTAKQVVIASATLDTPTVEAFEELLGAEATLLINSFKPADGRKAFFLEKPTQLLHQMRQLAAKKAPFVLQTSSAEIGSKHAPDTYKRYIRDWWPEARVVDLTAKTVTEMGHSARIVLANPELAHNFDVLIASPVLETGFSVPDPDQHFQAVLIHSNGNTSPTSVVQSIGRLRSNVPRFIYVPTTGRRIGNGATDAAVLRWGIDTAQAALRDTILKLFLASEEIGAPSAFVRMWAEFGAADNAAAAEFRDSVSEKLEVEGYACDYVFSSVPDSEELNQRLRDHRDESLKVDCTRVVNAPTLTVVELETIAKRQTHTAEERAILERGKIKQHLGVDVDTVDQVKAARGGARQALLRRLLMLDSDAAGNWVKLKSRTLSDSQIQYSPDMVRHFRDGDVAHRLAYIAREVPQFVELISLAGTDESFTVDRFEALTDFFRALDLPVTEITRWNLQCKQHYGFNPGADSTKPRTILNGLLKLIGYKLRRVTGRRRVDGKQQCLYVVEDTMEPLNPAEVLRFLAADLVKQLEFEDRGETFPLIKENKKFVSPPEGSGGAAELTFTDAELNASMAAALARWD